MSKPPLIVNIVTQMEAGGAQGGAVRMAEHLAKRGHRSEVWFLYVKTPIYSSHPQVRWLTECAPRSASDLLWLLRELRRWLIEERPEGVITYTHYANILGQLVAWHVGVQYRLATQRSPAWSYPRLARVADLVLGSVGIYTANILVSNSIRESFYRYPKSYLMRTGVVINGLPRVQPSLAKSEARMRLALPQNCFVVVNVGRLAAEKNQGLLLEALAHTRREDIVLAIAGDGSLRQTLVTKASKLGVHHRTFFIGELPPFDIANFLAAADVFAFPSRFEAFGFALVEAMMVGLPVLASEIPAHREVLGDSGIFLPVSDPEAWAKAILYFVENKNACKEWRDRAMGRAGNFDIENMVDGYLGALFGKQ